MRIAIECTLASSSSPTGLGIYVDSLLTALSRKKSAGKDTFFLLHSQKTWQGKNYGPNFIPVSYHFTNSQFLAIFFRLGGILKKLKADVFHATCTTGVPPNIKIPAVTTVHDIFPLTLKGFSWKYCFLMKLLFHWVRENSNLIICNSNFTKSELVKYGLEKEKLKVIYLGSQFNFESKKILPQYICQPYYLCVGALEKRKGQRMLCMAYLEALKIKPDLPDLLLVGPDRGDAPEIMGLIAKSEKIKWLAYVDKEKLNTLYKYADLLIFPSFHEGFGLPVIEAMKAGVPVLCSDIPVLREIAANYARLVPPDENSFTMALLSGDFKRITQNAREREKNMEIFSWEKNALETLATYSEVRKGYAL